MVVACDRGDCWLGSSVVVVVVVESDGVVERDRFWRGVMEMLVLEGIVDV